MFNLFNWLGIPARQKTYRLRITDSQGNQTYKQHNCPAYNQEKPETSNVLIAYPPAEWNKGDKP
jgi:hypothetical protein